MVAEVKLANKLGYLSENERDEVVEVLKKLNYLRKSLNISIAKDW